MANVASASSRGDKGANVVTVHYRSGCRRRWANRQARADQVRELIAEKLPLAAEAKSEPSLAVVLSCIRRLAAKEGKKREEEEEG